MTTSPSRIASYAIGPLPSGDRYSRDLIDVSPPDGDSAYWRLNMLSCDAMNSTAAIDGLNGWLIFHQRPTLSLRDERMSTLIVSTTRPEFAYNESTYVQRFPRAKGIGGLPDSIGPTPLSLHDGTEAKRIKMVMVRTICMIN